MYASHACGSSLIRRYGTGMVMRLYLEGDSPSVAHIYEAGVFFAGAAQAPRAFSREAPQMNQRTFITTVLTP
jgi:hypothetical protein